MPRHGELQQTYILSDATPFLGADIPDIWHYTHHVSDIFPDDTNKLVTLTAGGVANTFGAWAAIVDGTPTEFSTVFAADDGHIASIIVEECSLTDVRYMLEVSYGAAKVIVARTRFMKVLNKLNVGHQMRIRSIHIPAGETVYYRLKCETANATAEVHFRYYLV